MHVAYPSKVAFLKAKSLINVLPSGIFHPQDTVRAGKCSNGAEMTEEEALAEQQRMFAEARARMNGGVTVPSKQPDSEVDQNLNN